jgi:hypothetical protein
MDVLTIPEEPESVSGDRRWFTTSDGSPVFDTGPGTHVRMRYSPMAVRCIFCGQIGQHWRSETCPSRK